MIYPEIFDIIYKVIQIKHKFYGGKVMKNGKKLALILSLFVIFSVCFVAGVSSVSESLPFLLASAETATDAPETATDAQETTTIPATTVPAEVTTKPAQEATKPVETTAEQPPVPEITQPEETTNPPAPQEKPELIITGESMNVALTNTLQLSAKVTNVEKQPTITWFSSDGEIAVVKGDGLVTPRKVGRVMITARAKIGNETIEGYYAVNVTTPKNFIKSFLETNQVLSYQYSYVDDYYYTNDKDCWQDDFGFARIYDLVAPYVLMEYDYNRVFFTYEGQDFMIQFWKGQYGLLFYGGEIGIYSKPADGKEPGIMTFYKKPPEEFWPMVEMSLYHQKITGEYEREFTRDYDKYWWCTGFKDGHLRIQEPANELRIVGRITLPKPEMTEFFVQGLIDCGFKEATSKDNIPTDHFYVDGDDVHVSWQDISEAENTMPIKMAGAALFFFNFFALTLGAFLMLGLGSFGLIFLVFLI